MTHSVLWSVAVERGAANAVQKASEQLQHTLEDVRRRGGQATVVGHSHAVEDLGGATTSMFAVGKPAFVRVTMSTIIEVTR